MPNPPRPNLDEQEEQVNYTLVRLTLETIPYFDGDKDLLEIFIYAANNFFARYGTVSEELRTFTHQALIGKLRGNALLIVGSRPELNTWPLVREELRSVYGERLSLDNLEQMLMTCTIQKNEHYQNFGKRLQIIRSKLAQKVATTPVAVMDAASKLVHNRQYNTMACKIFVRNLDRRLRDKIIVQNPNSLETAMALARDDENFELFLNPNSNNNQNQFKSLVPRMNTQPMNRIPFSQNVHRPQKPQIPPLPPQQFPNQHFQPPFRQNNFPSQPINIQSRQVPHHYPTNRQVFGPPINVWKPQNKPQNQMFHPVPMSTTTKIPSNIPNTSMSRPTNSQNR